MPEETDEYIRIPVNECDVTATIDVSKDEGIKALYCGKDKKIATYLFLKEKGWTMAKAKKWVKEHKEEDSIPIGIISAVDIADAEIIDLTGENDMKSQIIEKEKRSYQVEMRIEDGERPKIMGHAAVFDKLSEDLGGYREQVAEGTFAETIENDDIRALFNHDPNFVLGRRSAGTLSMTEDKKGLAVEIDPPDTTWARDLRESIKRGDVNQMSFAFLVQDEEWNDQKKIRTLKKVKLYDVSVVTYPAYPQTSVKLRSLIDELGEDKAINILEETARADASGTEDPPETPKEAPAGTPGDLEIKQYRQKFIELL